MNRHGLLALLLLSGCFQPVDVGFDDAGADGGQHPPCTVGMDQSCNELVTMSAFAGTCTATGCTCNAGFEKAPSGKCRPSGTDAGSCSGNAPFCVSGTIGGTCGDALSMSDCTAGQWTCPQGTVFTTQCACLGRPPANCTCTPTGWSCPDAGMSCTPGVAMSCNEGLIDGGIGGVAGSCSAAGQCTCNAGFELNPATGRCRALVAPICTRTGLDQDCNELQVMASFAGECMNGRCVCNAGYELAPSGRCQPNGATCTDRIAMSCNDEPVDGGIGGVAGSCVVGRCACNAGFELNPATGRCRAVRPSSTCTVGMDQTCNALVGISAFAGRCVAGACQCNAGYALTAAGTCAPSSTGYCVVSDGMGTCRIETLDGGFAGNGLCGTQSASPACVCEPGTPPVPRCMGLCPPTAGRTCVTTNCGTISCLPPLRCTGTNICSP